VDASGTTSHAVVAPVYRVAVNVPLMAPLMSFSEDGEPKSGEVLMQAHSVTPENVRSIDDGAEEPTHPMQHPHRRALPAMLCLVYRPSVHLV
jgi:hypothetical protein